MLLTFKRTTDGLQLLDKLPIKNTAHTISDYDNLVFLSGNNGISIFEKTKKQMKAAAKELDFIEAARLRDEMFALQNLLSERKNAKK